MMTLTSAMSRWLSHADYFKRIGHSELCASTIGGHLVAHEAETGCRAGNHKPGCYCGVIPVRSCDCGKEE